MELDVNYISASCGRCPGIFDRGPNSISAFGTRNALALLETHKNGSTKIKHTFSGHKERINAVKWVRFSSGEHDDKIITGSADNSAIVWKKDEDDQYVFNKMCQLIGHTSTVNVVDALNDKELIAVTASMDSLLKIWKINKDGTHDCTQTINLENGLCLTLQLFNLPITNNVIFACALHDNNIHLYGQKINNKYELEFIKLRVLSGHEDWVRGLDFVRIGDDRLMLASCSQDTYIRVWSIDHFTEESNNDAIITEKKTINIDENKWTVSLETVLCGHESWVYSVNWNVKNLPDKSDTRLRLLSASLDKTLIIWEIDDQIENCVWIEKVRVGEVGGGGLGFYGGKFLEDGNKILGHGYLGSFHIWKHIEENDSWEPDIPCGGHFNEAVDISWEPNGEFLISISYDQTTRVHAPWVRNDSEITWHELARPQVHGYDMSSLAVIDRYKFASGAEEKVIRTFKAPNNFLENFRTICKVTIEGLENLNLMPEGASVPSLGLSNKAVFSNEPQVMDINEKSMNKQYTENRFIATKLQAPPTEETLMQNTLWPEQHKLYGHGYEIFALASSSDGTLLASACKASKTQHAAILLWDTTTWLQVQSLTSHNLTVTQMEFSPDSLCLLSVSRDRRWSIFRRESTSEQFFLDVATDKTNGVHARIIWCCSWTFDSEYFVTGSRDGKVVCWSKGDSESWKNFSANPRLDLPEQSITALSFAPIKIIDKYLLAAGFESGVIHVYTMDISFKESCWNLEIQLDNSIGHHLTVKRLRFRPKIGEAGRPESKKLQLASSSSDNSVKVYTLSL